MPRDMIGREVFLRRRPAVRRPARPGLGLCLSAALAVGLTACAPDYSPDVYNGNAVQQANKVESGVVVGFREVKIDADGTVGTVTGGAVGGILGSQTGEVGFNAAIGAVGGSAIGSMVGNAISHTTGDTTGWEYIVRKTNGDLLSVTQRQPEPIPIGQHVLVITGNQARIIRDYSVPVPTAAPTKEAAGDKGGNKTASAPKAIVHSPAAAPPPSKAANATPPAAPPATPPAAIVTLDPASLPGPAASLVAPAAAAAAAAAPASALPVAVTVAPIPAPSAGMPTPAAAPLPIAVTISPAPAAPAPVEKGPAATTAPSPAATAPAAVPAAAPEPAAAAALPAAPPTPLPPLWDSVPPANPGPDAGGPDDQAAPVQSVP